jgi:uncharacterized cupredoxin-like copper-binding protein
VRRQTGSLLAAAAAVIVLAAASTLALAAAGGGFRHRGTAPSGQCSAPALPGTVIDVTLTNMGGGAMMRGSATGGMMRVLVNKDQAAAGTVSLRVANTGSLVHELIVLPLAGGQQVGDRAVGADNRVDETGSVGEASHTCAAGAGDGIDPGALSWVTVSLTAGRYELLCNLAGHYAAGMYTELTVS